MPPPSRGAADAASTEPRGETPGLAIPPSVGEPPGAPPGEDPDPSTVGDGIADDAARPSPAARPPADGLTPEAATDGEALAAGALGGLDETGGLGRDTIGTAAPVAGGNPGVVASTAGASAAAGSAAARGAAAAGGSATRTGMRCRCCSGRSPSWAWMALRMARRSSAKALLEGSSRRAASKSLSASSARSRFLQSKNGSEKCGHRITMLFCSARLVSPIHKTSCCWKSSIPSQTRHQTRRQQATGNENFENCRAPGLMHILSRISYSVRKHEQNCFLPPTRGRYSQKFEVYL